MRSLLVIGLCWLYGGGRQFVGPSPRGRSNCSEARWARHTTLKPRDTNFLQSA